MSGELENRVAVVTGAGGEIGFAIAKKLHACGARLVLLDIDMEGLHRTLAEIGAGCHVEQVDLTDHGSVSATAERIQTTFGGTDLLINNAGIVQGHKPTWEVDPEEFHRVLNVNLMGIFHCIRAFVPQMRQRQKQHGQARIINMASYLGYEPQGFESAYAASKAGVIALTKSLARELASEGLLVNCVAPTVVESRMGRDVPADVLTGKIEKIPMGRLARTDEVAAMVAWLCSPECSFTTGAVFDVSGGRASR